LHKKWNGVLLTCWDVVRACAPAHELERPTPSRCSTRRRIFDGGSSYPRKKWSVSTSDLNGRNHFPNTTSPSSQNDLAAGKLPSAARL